MVGWPFNADQTIALIGPATIAAIIAAIFAIRADTFGRRNARELTALRDFDIQPRVDVGWTPLQANNIVVQFGNVGGPAPRFVWVGSDDTKIGMCTGTIGHAATPLAFRGWLIGESTYRGGMGTILLVAEDVQGRWWDCRTGVMFKRPLEKYLKRRMEHVGLEHLAEQVVLQVPRKMPPDATFWYDGEQPDQPAWTIERTQVGPIDQQRLGFARWLRSMGQRARRPPVRGDS
jgi:hypothetical protein